MRRSPSDEATGRRGRPAPTPLAPLPSSSAAGASGAGCRSATDATAGCPVPVGGSRVRVESGASGGGRLGARSVPSPVAGPAARAADSPASPGEAGTGSAPAGASARRARGASADGGLFAVPFFDCGSNHHHRRGITRRRLGVSATLSGHGFHAGGRRRRLGPGEFPVQCADEGADQPSVAAEVPEPPGARSRTEIHPRLRLHVESDADHHVARAAGKPPSRQGVDDAFLLVPPAGMPARQFTANEIEHGFPYLSERNGIGPAHETRIGGVGRCSGSRRHKRALETIGKREFLAQPVPPWRPGWRNRGNSQRLILRWSASDFHSAG